MSIFGWPSQEILDSFSNTEFWYIDQGIITSDASGGGSASFRKTMQRQEEKWWLPVPRVPSGGLGEDTRRQLNHKRECANQILKASMSINSIVLAEMEVPESYFETLPKVCNSDKLMPHLVSVSGNCLKMFPKAICTRSFNLFTDYTL